MSIRDRELLWIGIAITMLCITIGVLIYNHRRLRYLKERDSRDPDLNPVSSWGVQYHFQSDELIRWERRTRSSTAFSCTFIPMITLQLIFRLFIDGWWSLLWQ